MFAAVAGPLGGPASPSLRPLTAAPYRPQRPARAKATGRLPWLADTLREAMELGFDPKDHTEAEVLHRADGKRIVECGTALAAR